MIDSRYGVGETIGETIGEIHINMQYDIGAHDPKGLREKKKHRSLCYLSGRDHLFEFPQGISRAIVY